MPFYFPSVGEYAPLLEQAGLQVTHAFLFDRMTPLKGGNGLMDWMKMFLKTPFGGMDDGLKEEILRETAEALRPALFRDGVWCSDYVRLRCRAVKR